MAATSLAASLVVFDMLQPNLAMAVTTVTVNTTADVVDGNPATTSLREAVDAANADSQATEIVLSAASVYDLTRCGASDDDNSTGDLDHTDDAQVTIFANGSTIRQTCPGERVVEHFEPSTSIVIDDATITGGNVTGTAINGDQDSIGGGGGVLSHGRGVFTGTTVTGNSAEDLGGGVRVVREASFMNAAIDGNDGGGGGAAVGRNSDFEFTISLLSATNSSFDDNVGDGLSVFQGFGSIESSTANSNTDAGLVPKFMILSVNQSEMNNNGGSGIDSLDGPLTIIDSEANGNGDDGLKTTGAGSVHLTGVDVFDNGTHGVHYLACDGQGLTDVITATDSTVSGNGGTGLFDDGCGGIAVENTTVSNNSTGIDCVGCSSIRVEFSTVADNTAGGGIRFEPDDGFLPSGSLIVRATDITGNVAPGDGGGINVVADGTFDVSVVVSESSEVVGNTASGGDGGGIAVDGADFFLTNSAVSDNTAGDPDEQLNGPFGRGGGISVRNGSLSVALAGMSGNRANGDGGAISHAAFSGQLTNIFSLTASDNVGMGTGGAVDIDSAGSFTLTDSTIVGNQSTAQGGAVAIRNTPTTIERSTFADNTSGAVGSAIFGFENQNPGFGILLDSSTVTGNSGSGGAVFAQTNAPTEIRNSTVSGNNSVGVGAGAGTDVVLRFATVVENAGGNIALSNGDLASSASVLADAMGGDNCDIGGSTFSNGSNADTDGTCGFSNVEDLPDLPSTGLGALGANGGPTDTHPILSGSPLRDAVLPVLCTAFVADQRGTARPQGPACDIGSYESQGLTITALTWDAIARLGQITFPVSELVQLENFTPDPSTLMLLDAPDGIDIVVDRGRLLFQYRPPQETPGSPILLGEFPILFELCALEDPGACGQGTVLLSLDDPSENCTIEGTDRRDVLRGTNGDDVICAGGGNDIIFGRGGNDIIISGDGRDIAIGGRGDDIITGDGNNDLLIGQRGEDWLDGGAGRDICLPFGGVAFACESPRNRRG